MKVSANTQIIEMNIVLQGVETAITHEMIANVLQKLAQSNVEPLALSA